MLTLLGSSVVVVLFLFPPSPQKKNYKKKQQPPQFFTRQRSDECAIQRGNVPRLSPPNEIRAGCICHGGGRRDITHVVESFRQHSGGRGRTQRRHLPTFSVPLCDFFFSFHLSACSSEAGFFFFFPVSFNFPPCCCNGRNYLLKDWRWFDTQWSSSRSRLACSGWWGGANKCH